MEILYDGYRKIEELLEPEVTYLNKFIFDLPFSRPFELILPASLINEREIDVKKVTYITRCEDSKNYARYMNFFEFIRQEEGTTNKVNNRYHPIQLIDLSKYYRNKNNIIEQLANKIANIFSDDKQIKELLNYVIFEILRNVPEHAETNNAWICAQNWEHPNYKEIEVAIVDYGVGITNNLAKKYPDLTEKELIEKALSPGITTSNYVLKAYESEMYANSGYGIYVVSKLCKALNGEFTIITGNTVFESYQHSTFKRKLKNYFPGTAVKIKMQLNEELKFKNLIDLIVEQGEKTAGESKGTIKTASMKSRIVNQ